MQIQEPIVIDVDVKKPSYLNPPQVTQNDRNTFVVNVFDNGQSLDLSNVTTATITHTRPDTKSVVTSGTVTGFNQITFIVDRPEASLVGRVDAVVQLYNADSRISTFAFNYKVNSDPSQNYVPSDSEKTLIEVVLGEGPAVIEEAVTQAKHAEIQGNYVEEKRPLIDKFTSEQDGLQAQIDTLIVEGDSSPEAAQARVSTNELGQPKTYTTLKQRLDTERLEVMSHLAQNTTDITIPFRVISEENAKNWIPNVKEPLNIPTYDGSGQTTHPSVLYFENGWNGYKFWMCHTPYPFGDNQKENPSISASNDNITWFEPAPNPIAPLPANKGFQSDGNIFMRANTMEMWWRATTNVDGFTLTEIFRKTTTDGVNWSPTELLFDNRTWNIVRSPAVKYINGKYCMWYNTDINGTYYIKYAESVDSKTWINDRILDINFKRSNQYMWHLDVLISDGKYELLIVTEEQFGNNAIYYTSSLDNKTYSEPVMIIQPTFGSGKHDGSKLYKPSMVKVGNEYYVYYGSISESAEFHVGLTKGTSPLLLGLDDTNKKEIKTIRYWKSNEFVASDPISKYPKNQITISKLLGFTHGFPVENGLLITDTTYSNTSKRDQTIKEFGTNNVYYRYVKSDGTWSPLLLQIRTEVTETNAFVASDPITKYPSKQITITKITSPSSGFPVTNGTLITDTMIPEKGRYYQTLKEYNGHREFKRYVKSDGTWNSFLLQNKIKPNEGQKQVSETSIPARGVIEKTVTVNGVIVSDMVLGNPVVPLENGLIFNVFVSATDTVSIRIANMTDAPINMLVRQWNFTVIQKNY